jgi:hypothetical protein
VIPGDKERRQARAGNRCQTLGESSAYRYVSGYHDAVRVRLSHGIEKAPALIGAEKVKMKVTAPSEAVIGHALF